MHGLDHSTPAMAPASLESLLRRNAVDLRQGLVVILAINVVCMAVAGLLL